MTEERKQELSQLLGEAKRSLEVRQGYDAPYCRAQSARICGRNENLPSTAYREKETGGTT